MIWVTRFKRWLHCVVNGHGPYAPIDGVVHYCSLCGRVMDWTDDHRLALGEEVQGRGGDEEMQPAWV